MSRPRRLLSIAHSYAVALNRRLAHEMQRVGAGRWEVTAAAPAFFHGDLRPVLLEADADQSCRLEPVQAHFTRWAHVMVYGWRLRELLRGPWDLVHCWEEPYVLAGGQVAWWTPPRTPLVFSSFQNISKRYPIPFSWIERYCLRRCSGWMGAGETQIQTLLPRGYGLRPHSLVPLGVDMALFRPDSQGGVRTRKALGWDESGPPVVGFLGRFVPEKGLGLLTRVLDRVGTPWRALFIGGGPLESFLRRWGRRHGDRVKVLTGVPHGEVPAYLNALDALCAPSQTMPSWREQFGRMLIEAFACGVPVIASDSGEIPAVVGEAGLVIGEKDEPGWARALEEILENPSRRQELSRRGLERARDVYAWPQVARQHLDFFDQVLSQRSVS